MRGATLAGKIAEPPAANRPSRIPPRDWV